MDDEKKRKFFDINAVVERVETTVATLIAKKDFIISHNEYVRKITAGEDISDVPSHYHENLRTEGVL